MLYIQNFMSSSTRILDAGFASSTSSGDEVGLSAKMIYGKVYNG